MELGKKYYTVFEIRTQEEQQGEDKAKG